MPRTLERISLTEALQEIYNLFNRWGLSTKDYVLVDEFAYLLQEYDVKATEVESGHLDVYVNPVPLPWKVKEERSVIPPKDSIYMDDWLTFMQKTGYSLDMLRAKPEILKIPSVSYAVLNGNSIQIMRAYEMTEAFVQQTLMHYSLEEVGKEKILEWMDKLEMIRKVAEKKKDSRLARLCKDRLAESRGKWESLL